MFVVFVANWCGHCEHLKPIWKKMERALKKTKSSQKGIIAMIYSDYRDRVNVSSNCDGYPTIKMYKNCKVSKEWNGDWTQKGVLENTVRSFFSEKTKKIRFKKKIIRKHKTKRKYRKRRNKTQKRRR